MSEQSTPTSDAAVQQLLDKHFDADTNTFLVTQVADVATTFDIHFAGILELKGTIDTDTLNVDVALYATLPVLGNLKLAEASGNLNDGVTLTFNAAVASGTVKLYLKNGNEVWLQFNVSTLLATSVQGDVKVLTLP